MSLMSYDAKALSVCVLAINMSFLLLHHLSKSYPNINEKKKKVRVEFSEFFIYMGFESFDMCMYCAYFHPVCSLC